MRFPFKSQIFASPEETAERLAMDFIRYTEEALKYRDNLYIALSGGSTPQLMFEIIAREYPQAIKWQNLHFFWVDERCVPHESSESNYGNAFRLLFSKVKIPIENLHPILGADKPEQELIRYTTDLLNTIPCQKSIPVFDIIFLGMGNDGHTASIFPGQEEIFKSQSVCTVAAHPQTRQTRITLTGKVINQANHIVLLVTGENKAKVLETALLHCETMIYPVQNVKPVYGTLSWYVDKEAAKLLHTDIFH